MSESGRNLLEARDLSKRYGPVVALGSATLVVEPGEVHALLGANGAGKSTLVKLLTGVIRPDAGSIVVNGKAVKVSSPAAAARLGLAPVFQDPALVPDLTIGQNLRLTGVSADAVQRELHALDLHVDMAEQALDVPLPILRMLDLARALARDPQLLILDEITAALPSDLAERVFEVMRRQKERQRSVLFITHRLREVIANCDRATILRDGSDVGILVPSEGGEEQIVEDDARSRRRRRPRRAAEAAADEAAPARERVVVAGDRVALAVEALAVGDAVLDVSFAVQPGRDPRHRRARGSGTGRALRRALRPAASHGGPAARRRQASSARAHPYDAIRAGVVLVPADRLQALLPQRSVAENIAAPRYKRARALGADQHARRSASASARRSSSSRSTRARSARCAASRAATSRR